MCSLFLHGCLYSGAIETGYLRTAIDLNEVTQLAGRETLTFNTDTFYSSHGKSIVSSDAKTNMTMNYVDSGDENKPAVLFVHGTPGDWTNFATYLVITELKNNAHLVAVDRPGWGASVCKTVNGDDCFYPLLKQQSKYFNTLLATLNEQNNHQGVILVGHSLGGPMIGQLAFDYPDIIKGLIFIAGPFDPELAHPRWYNRLAQIFTWLLPEILNNSNKEMLPLSSQLEQMGDVWASIDVPVWVIQGSKDDLVDRKNLDYSKILFSDKDAQFIEIETSGHFVLWEKYSVIVESITQALEKIGS